MTCEIPWCPESGVNVQAQLGSLRNSNANLVKALEDGPGIYREQVQQILAAAKSPRNKRKFSSRYLIPSRKGG
jgi:hypothetical protein